MGKRKSRANVRVIIRSLFSDALNTLGDHSRAREGHQIIFHFYGLPEGDEVSEDLIIMDDIRLRLLPSVGGSSLLIGCEQ